MSEFLFQYHPVAPATWAYLSSILMLCLFFKFSRVWSLRNLDLILLILLFPGVLILHLGYEMQRKGTDSGAVPRDTDPQTQGDGSRAAEPPTSTTLDAASVTKRYGYFWLLGAEALWLIRLLIDPAFSRRPLLTPNLTVGGLSLMGFALFCFLMANVISGGLQTRSLIGSVDPGLARMDRLMEYYGDRGPGYAVLNELPVSANRTLAVISHTAIIVGMILIGLRHFDNVTNGIGAAMLYLMLPYTTQMTGRLDHFLPAAFLVWAILCYRHPWFSGFFLGMAAGCVYYPLFLLPLWLSFYQHRGWIRFLMGVVMALALLTVGLIFTPSTPGMWGDLQRMFGLLAPAMKDLEGIWSERYGGLVPSYRIPVLATFAALSCSMALWPAHKNLATLISCSAALMLGTQFWHGWGGGLYIAWCLPLLLLTIFRPNLEDRVATAVVRQLWSPRRSAKAA
ncbi:MAG TPA: hypothetical protein VIY86_04315 [Pirellulaceae bacterium]